MGFSVAKYNGRAGKFTYNLKQGSPYLKLAELDKDTCYTVRGLFINAKSRYPHGVAVSDTAFIDLPTHLNDTIKAMIDDSETVDAINNGRVGLMSRDYQYQGKTLYTVVWKDIDDGFISIDD